MISSLKVSEYGHLELKFGNHAVVIPCGGDIDHHLADTSATAEDRAAIHAKAVEAWTPEVLDTWQAKVAAPAPTLADYKSAIQRHLDDKARELGYDSIFTAVGYRGDPCEEFALEAESLFAWRSAVWVKGTEILNAVNAGTRAAPTLAEVIQELPGFA